MVLLTGSGTPTILMVAALVVFGVIFIFFLWAVRGSFLDLEREERRAGGAGPAYDDSAGPRAGRTCSNPVCRHVNRPAACFCARCGLRLG